MNLNISDLGLASVTSARAAPKLKPSQRAFANFSMQILTIAPNK
jgi:hypothetical protein